MRRMGGLLSVLLWSAGCFDTELPPKVVVGPGTVRATVMTAVPGRSELVPAANAKLELLGTTLRAQADADGNVRLSDVSARAGRLLFSVDLDGDGVAERTRVVTLESVKAGFGLDVNLGQVVVGRNAVVTGVVKRGDRSTLPSGHAGITVFLPQLPQVAFSGDDGSFTLGGIPEGDAIVSFFAPGYRPDATSVRVTAGQEVRLGAVVLEANPGGPPVGRLSGRAQQVDGTPIAAVEVRAALAGVELKASTDAEGRFAFETIPTGVYALALEKSGFRALRVDGVLVMQGVNEVGPYVLTAGEVTVIPLDGGLLVPDASVPFDAGAPVDSGVAFDGGNTSDAGVATDSGVELDAGVTSDAGSTASDAGTPSPSDAGTPPTAVVGAALLVTPGAQVTLDGTLSFGAQPLTYTWQQLAGPTVTLSTNQVVTSHSPRFTAGSGGSVYEFALTVTDRFGVSSTNSAVARVAVGSTPTARFTPDSGLYAGGQTVVLQSTSFDDGGLVLTQYEWAVVSGGTGTLVTDGGAQALFTLPPVAFSTPDVLTGIELRVTNAVGARSNPARQFYTVRGIAPGNWTLDAGTQQSILVTASPPQVQLNAAISTSIASPQYSVAWACTPSMPLLSGDTLAPRFVAPAISGPNQVVSCQVTATGQAPLDPPSLSGAVNIILRDGTPPTVVSHNIEPTRIGRFGFLVRASERLSSATFSAGCAGVAYGFVEEVVGRALVAGTAYSVLSTGNTCGSATVSMTDTAASPQTATNVPFGPSTTYTIQEEWAGPFESSTAYDDPRPVVTSLGILPGEAQLVAGASTSTPGYELLGASGSDFVRLAGLDVTQWPTCTPTCTLTATVLNLPAGTVKPVNGMQRSFHGGAQLFVVSGSDGGVVPEVIRRTENGTWAPFTGLTGAPGVWNGTLRVARADDGGQVLLDTYTPSTGTFTPNDVAATGLSDISLLSTTEDYLAIVSGASKTLLARYRNPSTQVWSTKTTGTAPTGITALQVTNMQGLALAVMQTATGLSIVRLDSGSSLYTLSATPVAGFDVADWGQNVYVVYATGGDIRFKTIAGSVWSGAGGGPVDFGGPPRAGFPTPYPLVLDGDPLCEAAWPRMAFIDGVLVVVWQERCSPATQWKIMARLVR